MSFQDQLDLYVRDRKRQGESAANKRLYQRRIEALWGVRHARYAQRRYGAKGVGRALERARVLSQVARFVSRGSWIRGQGFAKTNSQ